MLALYLLQTVLGFLAVSETLGAVVTVKSRQDEEDVLAEGNGDIDIDIKGQIYPMLIVSQDNMLALGDPLAMLDAPFDIPTTVPSPNYCDDTIETGALSVPREATVRGSAFATASSGDRMIDCSHGMYLASWPASWSRVKVKRSLFMRRRDRPGASMTCVQTNRCASILFVLF